VTVGIQVPSGTEQPFTGNRRRGGERYLLATSAKTGLGLHCAYQGVIYKELVGVDGKKRNCLIYRVVESLEVQFSPWLLKGVATDVNCLSNSGQEEEGGEDATSAGLQDSDGSSCGRPSNALFLVQCKPAA